MSDKKNANAINLLKRLKNNWDCVRGGNQTVAKAAGLTTKDCAELSRNSRHRNVLLGLVANHGQPPSLEEVSMDRFKLHLLE
jgi:hypothetical protein